MLRKVVGEFWISLAGTVIEHFQIITHCLLELRQTGQVPLRVDSSGWSEVLHLPIW